MAAIFAKAGRFCDVFVQVLTREGRRFKFGFVRYENDQDAWREVCMFNVLKLEGAFLHVRKSKFQRKSSNVFSHNSNHHLKYVVRGRTWKSKVYTQKAQGKSAAGQTPMLFIRLMRMARCTMYNVQTVEVV